jgi:phosphoserine phosphatase
MPISGLYCTRLKGSARRDVDALHSDFFEGYIRGVMLPQAIECVEQHQRAGHTCMVITATSEVHYSAHRSGIWYRAPHCIRSGAC